MITVVLDTNVLASGIVSTSTPPGQVLNAWRDSQFELITSKYILDELTRTLQKPYFQNYINSAKVASFIDLLQNEATITPITINLQGITTHPEDDLTFAAAISAKADYFVTGDKHLIAKVGKNYRGVALLTPSDFLYALEYL